MNIDKESITYCISEFKQGNANAFAYVFDLHYRGLRYYAASILDNEEEAEEAVSDVFVKLWQKAADFDNLDSIKGFLFISTRNRCLDRLKQSKREQHRLGDYAYALSSQSETDDYLLLETEVLMVIYEEIEQLPTKAQMVFKLIFFDGLKTNQVAEKMGVSIKTVRNQKARAIRLIQTALLKKGMPAYLWAVCLLWHH